MTPPGDRQAGARGPRAGANGPGRSHVAEIQRARMLAAMVDVAVERGLANSTVAHVVGRSGVSRRTFYELFEDREDCFLAALDDTIAHAAGYVVPAYQAPGSRWRERIRGGLSGLLSFVDAEPRMGRLMIVESLGAGPKALERRNRVLVRLIAAVDEGRHEARARRDVPELTAEGVVGAVLSVIHARLVVGGRRRMVELTSPLMAQIVLPYLGHAAAEREAALPAPTPTRGSRAGRVDPLRDLEMRPTYRTVRVLIAIGAQPGASNREIGTATGVEDQGQISKLLARLARLGLIENSGGGHVKGAPNAWGLTERGREVQVAIAPAGPGSAGR